jgi:hypothetical protein
VSAVHSPFSSWLITSSFSVFADFSRIALGDVGLCFSLILVTKVNAVVGGLYQPHDYIASIISTCMTDGMTVT